MVLHEQGGKQACVLLLQQQGGMKWATNWSTWADRMASNRRSAEVRAGSYGEAQLRSSTRHSG